MRKKIISIGIICTFLIGINFLSSFYHTRLDLTDEKRYTIAQATKTTLNNLESDIFVKVYLTGTDLPAGFKRLESAIKQTLDEFKAEAGNKINYRYIDIYSEILDDAERIKLIETLAGKGVPPTNITSKKNGKSTQNLIVPGAIISYKSEEKAILLLKGNKLNSPQQILNQSIENVEFELADGIKQISRKEKKKIGFFVNYSSLAAIQQIDLINTLKKNYDLFPVDITASPTLDGLDAIFVLKPDKPFTDVDKFKIDQFIVKGGKALFFIDPVTVDTVGLDGNFAKPGSVNLEDMLFKYGIRLNSNLLKDLQMSAGIPMNVGNMGDSPNIQLVPWPYFPLINSFGNSPIVRNLDAVYHKYSSTIDTVNAVNIKKTPLLLSSQYTQILNTPATISYNSAAKDFDKNKQVSGIKATSYLLEGRFESMYANSILPTDPRYSSFKTKDQESKIIVCADGDVPTNDFDPKTMQPFPLGFDKYSNHTFANKEFVENAVGYLLDPEGLISVRNKIIKLRPLDKIAITENQTWWQILNLLIPIGLLAFCGLIFNYTIKMKYKPNN